MHAREIVGPQGMACALRSPGVQGSMAVTLNQNRRLPFECLQGRRMGGQINTKVGSGVSNFVTPVPSMWICVTFSPCFFPWFLPFLYDFVSDLSLWPLSMTSSHFPSFCFPIYDLRNEVAQNAAIPISSPRTPSLTAHSSFIRPFYLAAPSALVTFYQHPWTHNWPTTQVIQETRINVMPLWMTLAPVMLLNCWWVFLNQAAN